MRPGPHLHVDVPPGVTAQIELPASRIAGITESGVGLKHARGILRICERGAGSSKSKDARRVTVVGSGTYTSKPRTPPLPSKGRTREGQSALQAKLDSTQFFGSFCPPAGPT